MDPPRSTTAPAEDRVIHLTADLPLPPEDAFEWFSSESRLRAWLAPRARVEPAESGLYELFWNPDDEDNDSTIGCRITVFEPPGLLAFQWRSPRQFKAFANAADPLTHVVVAFAGHEAGTRVHLVHSGWRSAPAWEEARRWQARAWTLAFRSLAQAVRGDAP